MAELARICIASAAILLSMWTFWRIHKTNKILDEIERKQHEHPND
jgi:hypothetical protein